MNINENPEWLKGAVAVSYRLHNLFRYAGQQDLADALEDLSTAYLMNDSLKMRQTYRRIQDLIENENK